MTNESNAKHDFQIERPAKKDIVLVTPLNHRAWDWCAINLKTCVRWGQSFVMDKKRGNPLKGYLEHKEGFSVLA